MSKTFFISYTKTDIAWAEWVAWQVEDLGFKVIIQVWDFVPGKSWVQEIHEAIDTADIIICILSDDFLASVFATAEWQAVFVDDPIGREKKILPIRIKPCNPGGLLKARVYVDLVGKDRPTATSLVRQSILDGRRKPMAEPPFPPDHKVEPTFPGARVRYAFVIDGDYSELEKKRVETLLKHFQKAVRDTSLTIIEITEGSMIVHIESSYELFRLFQKEFFDKTELRMGQKKVLGIWPINDSKQKPIEQRLEFYRESLINYFLSEGVDRETAKDLTQDVILNLYSDSNKYQYLSSAALTINLARIALENCLKGKEREASARRKYISPADRLDWDEIYRVSIDVLKKLPDEDRFILENFWNSRFVKGKFHHTNEDYEVSVLDAAVHSQIQANFNEDEF